MSKSKRRHEDRRQSLLHLPRIWLATYAEEVFNLSGSELIFLLVAGLVVLGPERLPGVIRRAGRVYGEVRRASQSFEKEFRETFQEPLDDISKSVKDITRDFGTVDPDPSPPMRPEMPSPPSVLEGDADGPP